MSSSSKVTVPSKSSLRRTLSRSSPKTKSVTIRVGRSSPSRRSPTRRSPTHRSPTRSPTRKHTAYCLHCKQRRVVSQPSLVSFRTSKRPNGKRLKGECSNCGTKVSAIVSDSFRM